MTKKETKIEINTPEIDEENEDAQIIELLKNAREKKSTTILFRQ